MIQSILTLAGRDWQSYFMSMRGPSILFGFLGFLGLFFFIWVQLYDQQQIQAIQTGMGGPTIELILSQVLRAADFFLVLVVPAITMSSFAGERVNHTFKLLQSSPLSSWSVVLGKFAASSGMVMTLLIGALIFPFYTIAFGNPDLGVVTSAFIGIFLLAVSQVSLGLWVSSLSKSPTTSYFITLLVLFLLMLINGIAPNLQTGIGFFDQFVAYLSTFEHFEAFLEGQIGLKHIMFFVLFTYTFLFLTVVSFDSKRWS